MAFPLPANIWTSWNLDPVPLIFVVVLATARYLRGFARLWRRRSVARATRSWQTISFLSGIL